MTVKKRRRLVYLLTAVFFISGAIIVLYVQGFRLDFANFRITKVGAIFVRAFPKDAQIILDGKEVKNSSGLFEDGTLLGNLFPKSYFLELRRVGYKKWRENVSVNPSVVAEMKNAVLVPEQSEVFSTGTIDFFVTDVGVINSRSVGRLFLNGEQIASGKFAGVSENSENLLYKKTNGEYVWRNLKSGSELNVTDALNQLDITITSGVISDRFEKSSLVIPGRKKIYIFNTESRSATKIVQEKFELGEIISSKDYLTWPVWNATTGTSSIEIYDKSSEKIATSRPGIEGKIADLALVDSRVVILGDSGKLFVFNIDDGSLIKISEAVKNIEVSPNKTLIAAAKNGSLEIFSLNSKDYYRFNLSAMGVLDNVVWYGDNGHLFLIYPNRTEFLDLNDKSLGNIITVTESNRIGYDQKENRLYYLSGSKLFFFQFPKK